MIRCAPHVSWIVQPDGVLLVNDVSHGCQRLRHPRSAVWDLLTRHGPAEVARKLTYIADLAPDRAWELVEDCVTEWIRLGYLLRERNDG